MTAPTPRRLPRASSRSASPTRAHSVTTWRARRRSTGSVSSLRSPSSHRPSGRPRTCAARSHSARRVAYGVLVRRRGASLWTITKAASSGIGTRRVSSVAKSMCSPCPAAAPAMASGSSRPTCAPALRSASWQARASARGSGSWPRASSIATEKAALEDRPAPTGSVLVTRAAPPLGGGWARRSAGRQGGFGRNRGGVAQGDLERPAGELVRVDPDEEAARFRREADLGGQVDGHGQREPAVVVGVVADEGDSSGGAGGGHAPAWRRTDRLDRRGRRGSRSCDGRPQWTAERDQDHRAGGHRSGALHLHDAGRRRRAGAAPGAGGAGCGRARGGAQGLGRRAVLGPVEPVPAVGRHRPQESRRGRARARAGRAGRRADRGVPARRGRAAGRRARRLLRPQPPARLRAHDGLGPGRADGAHGRARHRLHRHRRRPVVVRPGRLAPGAAAQPRGRLRRWRHAAGLRHGGRAARGGPLGRGSGGRRRHGRRRGVAHDDDPRLPRTRPLERRAGGEHARHRRALLRGLRDVGREVDGGGRHRGAVLRRAARRPRPGRRRVAAAPAGAGGLAGHEGALRGDLQVEDPRRVDGHLRRHRRLRGTRSCRRGRRTSTRTTWPARPSSRSTAPCSRRRRPASPRRRPAVSKPPSPPGADTVSGLVEWGVDEGVVAKLRESGALS